MYNYRIILDDITTPTIIELKHEKKFTQLEWDTIEKDIRDNEVEFKTWWFLENSVNFDKKYLKEENFWEFLGNVEAITEFLINKYGFVKVEDIKYEREIILGEEKYEYE